jgi:hypothetical protein
MAPLSLFRYIMNQEVTRLRRLRQSALKVRALATLLDTRNQENQGASLYERAALLNWRIARIATGHLRSHPYRSYQRDPSFFESGADRLAAILLGTMASLRGDAAQTFLRELRGAARELDDTRALTLSAELSDALGRAQSSMRNLVEDAQAEASREAGLESDARLEAAENMGPPRLSTSSYLAL